jgi:hypothetical protein
MKHLISPLALVAAIILFAGCSEKFNIGAPYKAITVVYALLDESDTAHYVRVQKAFLDQNKSALTMAQNPDSNFNASLSVVMKRMTFAGALHDSFRLNRVDMNQEGYPKQSGVFFNAPNYAYKFTNKIEPQYIYRIMVYNPATGETDSADAPIIDDRNVSAFRVDIIHDTNRVRAGLDFASTLQNNFVQFSVTYNAAANFSFEGLNNPAYFAQAIVQFKWVDSNQATGVKVPDSGSFNIGYKTMYSTGSYAQANYSVADMDFYNNLLSVMGNAPANTYRLLDRCKMTVYVGTADYWTYYQTSLTQGTGLTGNEIEPIYTNVHGKNALGLYTSRGVASGPVNMTINTIDSLIISPMFKNARIVGTAYSF